MNKRQKKKLRKRLETERAIKILMNVDTSEVMKSLVHLRETLENIRRILRDRIEEASDESQPRTKTGE